MKGIFREVPAQLSSALAEQLSDNQFPLFRIHAVADGGNACGQPSLVTGDSHAVLTFPQAAEMPSPLAVAQHARFGRIPGSVAIAVEIHAEPADAAFTLILPAVLVP